MNNEDDRQVKKDTFTIEVYTDDGRIFSYEVGTEAKVLEHSHAIVTSGYRTSTHGVFEHYPPHRISKVKSYGVKTQYPDSVKC